MTNTADSNARQAESRQAVELKQVDAELSPKNPIDLSHAHLRLGIDVGSTTVKLAVIDDNDNLIYANYERHHTDVKATAKQVFQKAERALGNVPMRVSITGSGGMLLAQWLGVEFVQEVIASKHAVEALIPQTDCAIELGGEDAKIIYFDNGIEQRMNGTCAGGTGAFIDEIAALLKIDVEQLDDAAAAGCTVYDISGRCGVYAKTDIQPLLNQGASRDDLALSAFHAIAKQTIGGLAQGLEIKKPVAFEGGPLTFNPRLIAVFAERLGLGRKDIIIPDHPETIVAVGAALALEELFAGRQARLVPSQAIKTLEKAHIVVIDDAAGSAASQSAYAGKPFFKTDAERAVFNERHQLPQTKTALEQGNLPKTPRIPWRGLRVHHH